MKMPADINTPPLQPNSPQEIATFQSLDLALRSRPELAREGATILNPKALSRLVEGIRYFQETHLGRKAKGANENEWPLIRLPDEIFRSRKSDGPLFTVFLSCYRQKKESSWRQFDFVSPKRFDDNIILLKRIEKDLIASGHLVRPVVYFDESVDRDRQREYANIVMKYGGRVVRNPNGTGENAPTHVVAWDPEEHDSEDTLASEMKVIEEGREREKLYLKSLIVIDPTKKKNTGAGGIIETTMADSKKKGGKVKGGKNAVPVIDFPLALVHWWYFPPSFDEWMPASDVAGEPENDSQGRPPNRPWAVSCKFIRDVDHFNEWGMEADYAIVDYEKKVAFFKELVRREQAHIAQMKKEANKRKKSEGDALRIRLSISSSLQGSKGTTDGKKKPQGMNPRQILTGFYNENGTKLKRTVYNGALKISPLASDIMNNSIKVRDEEFANNREAGKSSIKLPPVGTVLRPSSDKSFATSFLVTELKTGQSGGTVITSSLKPFSVPGAALPQRIRGGGGMNDNDNMMKMSDNVEDNKATSSTTKLEDGDSNKGYLEVENTSQNISSNLSKQLSQSKSMTVKVEEQPLTAKVKEQCDELSKAASNSDDGVKSLKSTTVSTITQDNESNNEVSIKSNKEYRIPVVDKLPPKPQSQMTTNPQTIISGSESKQQESLTADQVPTTAKPSWYHSNSVSDFEKRFLPEWFDKSSNHRSQASYIIARERIIDLARRSNNKYVTSTAVRRCVPGDAGSLLRLHTFLVNWGFINGSAIGDSAPTARDLTNAAYYGMAEKSQTTSANWNDLKKRRLVAAVTSQVSKRRKLDNTENEDMTSIDWDLIANEVGEDCTAFDCHQAFISIDFDSVTLLNDQAQSRKRRAPLNREGFVRDIVGTIRPEVLSTTIDKALGSSDFDFNEGQKTALLGVISSQAEKKAREEEVAISDLLQKILDQRMSKLENRLSILDDIEGMLDAERLALELERRDLYTTRCRQWFAGDK